MAKTAFKGNTVNTAGNLPAVGSLAPNFSLVKTDLSELSLKDFSGKKILLNIFPSIDTGVCATSVRQFNSKAGSLNNVAVICISKDLPFAHKRFCAAEGIEHVVSASEYRNTSFSDAYKVGMTDGPLQGLFSRSVVVIDEKGKIVYTELVPEITQEPDYDKALKALS